MRISSCFAFYSFICFFSALSVLHATEIKEWTFLIYLNGNNNLDRFGDLNVNQMEEVGSTHQINVVVQKASLSGKKTQRLFVTQDTNPFKVTSPVVQDMGNIDMGDWRNLVEFVKWGVENYPAQHYFIDVWNHGSGWRLQNRNNLNSGIMDISFDDNTGNKMTTVQLGLALTESAKIIGHKVDLYASDACLMAMLEVADQVAHSVDYFGGSEEVEPGAGWPYNQLLKRWTEKTNRTAAEVGAILTEEYTRAYSPGGQSGLASATFSVFKLAKMEGVNTALKGLGKKILTMSTEDKKKINKAISEAQNFSYSDYSDLLDFLKKVEAAQITELNTEALKPLRDALGELIISNATSPLITRALGAAIWLPRNASVFNQHKDKYSTLKFHENTRWSEVLAFLLN